MASSPGAQPPLPVATQAEQIFQEEGIAVRKDAETLRVERRGDLKVVTFRGPVGEETIEVDDILVATGKTPNTPSLKLERAEVVVDERHAIVPAPPTGRARPTSMRRVT